MTYRELLGAAASSFSSSDSPFLDAVLLLADSMGASKEKVLALLPEEVKEVPASFYEFVERRRRGESIAHIRGRREFFGREFVVSDEVLSPRQDTEVLVEAALEVGDALCGGLRGQKRGGRPVAMEKRPSGSNGGQLSVLDMCTGSGAVAISIAAERPCWRVTASDVSPAALDIAKQNGRRLLKPPVALNLIVSDLFLNIEGSYDLIVANPPYVEHAQAERFIDEGWKDPLLALDGGVDGMRFIRAIIERSGQFLSSDSVLLLEMDPWQISKAMALFEEVGFYDIRIWKDLAGRMRVAGAHHG